MKSVQLIEETSDLSGFDVREVEKPSPQKGQVLVKMKMAAVNPSDLNFIRGDYREALSRAIWNQGPSLTVGPKGMPFPSMPFALGGEGVGVVEASGGGFFANRLKGKRVALLAGPPMGTWQDYTIVDAKRCIVIPASMPDEQAAGYFINPLSAIIMLEEILKVKTGEWLLISAAGSALGKSVVRMAKDKGVKTICLVRGPENSAQLKALGATAVIETKTMDMLSEIAKITKGLGVDKAMDCVSGDTGSKMVQALALSGKMVVYGTLSGQPLTIPSRDLMTPVSQVSGFFMPNWMAQQKPLKLLSLLRRASRYASRGYFDNEIAACFPLDQVKEAVHSTLKQGRTGKTLLIIEQD